MLKSALLRLIKDVEDFKQKVTFHLIQSEQNFSNTGGEEYISGKRIRMIKDTEREKRKIIIGNIY